MAAELTIVTIAEKMSASLSWLVCLKAAIITNSKSEDSRNLSATGDELGCFPEGGGVQTKLEPNDFAMHLPSGKSSDSNRMVWKFGQSLPTDYQGGSSNDPFIEVSITMLV